MYESAKPVNSSPEAGSIKIVRKKQRRHGESPNEFVNKYAEVWNEKEKRLISDEDIP